MSFIPIDFGELVYRFSCTGVVDVMTFGMGFRNESAFTVQQCAVGGNIAYETNPMATAGNMGTTFTYLGCEATLATSTGLVSFFAAENRVGTSSAGRPPVNCAVLVQKLSSLGGRTNRGRLYHPISFLDESSIDAAGIIASASVATVQGWFDTFLDDLEAATLLPRILHQNPALTPTTIGQLVVQPKIGTQRRRLR